MGARAVSHEQALDRLRHVIRNDTPAIPRPNTLFEQVIRGYISEALHPSLGCAKRILAFCVDVANAWAPSDKREIFAAFGNNQCDVILLFVRVELLNLIDN